MQSAVLPPQFQKMFATMFDDAPQNSWADVDKVIREDFGIGPEELFGVSFSGEAGKGLMERTAKASASVAQVHWARLPDGREVAIKVQKREIAKQVSSAFYLLMGTGTDLRRSAGISGVSKSSRGCIHGILRYHCTTLCHTLRRD
jgi:predicted unusual protein kinase regulating ubiquinone biosynthesis (AarF/ABC1/UbiB family)